MIYDSVPGGQEYDSVPGGQEIEPGNDAAPEPAPVQGTQASRGTAVLAVDVPADAKIYVNGNQTTTEGSHRVYRSSGLVSGQTYKYEVRAVVDRDGKRQELTKSVKLTANSEAKISFEFANTEQSETVVTLHVPAEAKVNLAGTDTQKTGSKRVFRTGQLEAGQVWDDYRISVTLERGGQEITREKTVSISGGQAYEFKFDFNDSSVASK